ncbi:MAG: YraN family protein [Verrucomicrobiota bacterium]
MSGARLRYELLGALVGRHRLAPPPLESRGATGRWGEGVAADYLRRARRLKVLYRNYRTDHGDEVDLVVRDGDVLVFVEVRTRSASARLRPIETVITEKRRRLLRAARRWMQLLNNPDVASRMDIVEVILHAGEPPEVHHHPNAFEPEDAMSAG